MGRLSMATRREVVAAIRQRYVAATREEKGRIVDELVAVAEYHRKHAIRSCAGGSVELVVEEGGTAGGIREGS